MTPADLTFVPGAAGLGAFWNPIIERLPAEWTMRSFDLPGLGPVPPHPDVRSHDDLARYVASGIPAPTVLVGQSLGGYIALKLALARPDLVRRLVLVVAAAGSTWSVTARTIGVRATSPRIRRGLLGSTRRRRTCRASCSASTCRCCSSGRRAMR